MAAPIPKDPKIIVNKGLKWGGFGVEPGREFNEGVFPALHWKAVQAIPHPVGVRGVLKHPLQGVP